MTNNDLSRRSILAHAVAGVATAAPVAASTLGADNPDAELLALSAQIEGLLPAMAEANAAYNEAWQLSQDEAFRRLGLDPDNCYEGTSLPVGAKGKPWFETWQKTWKEYGADTLSERLNAIDERADSLHAAMRNLPIKTLSGVAAMARITAMLYLSNYWSEPEDDLDWEPQMVRHLIESICAAAGVSLATVPSNAGGVIRKGLH